MVICKNCKKNIKKGKEAYFKAVVLCQICWKKAYYEQRYMPMEEVTRKRMLARDKAQLKIRENLQKLKGYI